MFEQRPKPKDTEVYDVVSTYSEHVLAHSRGNTAAVREQQSESSSHSIKIILYKLFTAILELSDHLRYITLSGLRVEQESNPKTADH